MVHDTDIVELELRSKRFSLAVRKKEAIEALEPQVVYQVRWQPRAILSDLEFAPLPAIPHAGSEPVVAFVQANRSASCLLIASCELTAYLCDPRMSNPRSWQACG